MKKRYKYPLIAVGIAFAAAACGFGEAAYVGVQQAKLVSDKQKQDHLSDKAVRCLTDRVAIPRASAILFNRYADRVSIFSSAKEAGLREVAKEKEQQADENEALCTMHELIDDLDKLGDKLKDLSNGLSGPKP